MIVISENKLTLPRIAIFLGIIFFLVLLAWWWGEHSDNTNVKEDDFSPAVTLTMWTDMDAGTMNRFERRLQTHVYRVYEDLKVKLIQLEPETLQLRLADGEVPDLVHLTQEMMSEQLFNNISQNQFFSIPAHAVPAALYYNQDLFDRFGAEYPTPGQTWDELIPVMHQMTRYEEGVQYIGFAMDTLALYRFASPPEPSPFHRDSDNNIVREEVWKKWTLFIKQLLDTGYNQHDDQLPTKSNQLFLGEQRLAMWAGGGDLVIEIGAAFGFEGINSANFKWDLIPFPAFEHSNEHTTEESQHNKYYVNKHSGKYIEALLALTLYLNDSFIRTKASIKHSAEVMSNVHLSRLYDHTFRKREAGTEEDHISLLNAYNAAITGEEDINSALRITWERYEKIYDQSQN